MVKFIIESVNNRRKMRGVEFIKIEIIEDGLSNGYCWYSPSDLINEIENYGLENFSNIEKVDSILKHKKLTPTNSKR